MFSEGKVFLYTVSWHMHVYHVTGVQCWALRQGDLLWTGETAQWSYYSVSWEGCMEKVS